MGRSIVRLKDIANKTGFSTNTVSLALRKSPRIPEATREIIQSAALELNYLPNQIAKSLVSRQTKTIGLVITDITNPTLTLTAQALELALSKRGYGTLFATSNNTVEEEIKVVEMFRSRQVDGMLIYPASHHQLGHIKPLRKANYPVVLLVGDTESGLDAVCVDDRRGAYKATRHLIQLGHKRIGLIDSSHKLGNVEKLEGYQQALREGGIEFDPKLAINPAGHSAKSGYDCMKHVVEVSSPPTAIFASNDTLALGALRWCNTHGVRVPQDLAIIGYDNIELAAFAQTPISSVNYAEELVAKGAVDRLMELIEADDQLPDPIVNLIDPELITRESTGT